MIRSITNKKQTLTQKTEHRNNYNWKPVMNDEEKRKYMLTVCSKKLAQQAEFEVPENGKFSPKGIEFDLYGTNNVAILEISHNVDDPKTLRDVNIGVRHQNSDKVYNNFGVFSGTKEEIIKFLNNSDVEDNLKTIMNLSSKVDESCSSI